MTAFNSWPCLHGLTSLVMVCAGNPSFAQRSLASVLRNTRSRYELIVVSNGLAEEAFGELQIILDHPGPVRVEWIRNHANRGFAAACNLGLKLSRGDFIGILHDDIVLTPGWLEGLGRCFSCEPGVGLVGPVSNRAYRAQEVQADYRSLDRLEPFARQWQELHRDHAKIAKRLSTSCVLTRRDVLDRVGVFDEHFGQALLEDDDWCWRMRDAGYRLLVAMGVYVHHEGGAALQALNIDVEQLFEANLAYFRSKWGDERSQSYRLASNRVSPKSAVTQTPVVVGTGLRRESVSLCMIVKNEAGNLRECLRPVADVVDEIVVVDTGSTDGTKAVARELGCKIHDFMWIDHFAAARNASIQKASGEWIFWLDADDRVDGDNRTRLQSLFRQLGGLHDAYLMKVQSAPDGVTGAGVLVEHVRLFRNRADFRWAHRIHEQIMPCIRKLGGQVISTDIVVQHVGYVDPVHRREKLQRNLKILRLESAEDPDNSFTLFNLGGTLLDLGQTAEAEAVLRRSLELAHPHVSYVRRLYGLLIQIYRSRQQLSLAVSLCREGRQRFPYDQELAFHEALIAQSTGDHPGAERVLKEMMVFPEQSCHAGVELGLNSYKARHQLAMIYMQTGRLAEAEQLWMEVVAGTADFVSGWLGLADLYLLQDQPAKLAAMVERLQAQDPEGLIPTLLRARLLQASRDLPTARALLQDACARFPHNPWVRFLSSNVAEQLGLMQEASHALEQILALNPGSQLANDHLRRVTRNLGRN